LKFRSEAGMLLYLQLRQHRNFEVAAALEATKDVVPHDPHGWASSTYLPASPAITPPAMQTFAPSFLPTPLPIAVPGVAHQSPADEAGGGVAL